MESDSLSMVEYVDILAQYYRSMLVQGIAFFAMVSSTLLLKFFIPPENI